MARRHGSSWALLGVLWYGGLTLPLLTVESPWIALRFGLDTRGVARLYALMSLSAALTFLGGRLADRIGRRRLLVGCLVLTSAMAVCAALARSIVAFAACELLRFATVGAIANSAIALLAEAAPDSAARVRAVGKAGMAAAAGGASLLVLVPILVDLGQSSRAAFAVAAGGALFVPAVLRWVPESARWERAQTSGAIAGSSVFGVFRGPWSRRAVAVLGAALLSGVEGAAVGAWAYYYGVTVVGMSARSMSAWSLVATAAGFVGFRLGASSAERFGRVRTAVGFGLVHQAAALWIYLGPPRHVSSAALWIGLGLCLSGLGASASGMAKQTASVELFPTAERVTILGWVVLAGTIATGCSNLLVSALIGPLGGLPRAVALLSLSGVVGLIVFGLRVEETRGLSLDDAALEPEPDLSDQVPSA
ncbi:MAG TPA: MFS transporter [Polyangia bacterium]|nr:MFS transporter [Polyangia bacterium]